MYCKAKLWWHGALVIASAIGEEDLAALVACRVARWFIFKPKIQIWINFGGPIGKS
jgi:hypothetical protein